MERASDQEGGREGGRNREGPQPAFHNPEGKANVRLMLGTLMPGLSSDKWVNHSKPEVRRCRTRLVPRAMTRARERGGGRERNARGQNLPPLSPRAAPAALCLGFPVIPFVCLCGRW